MSTAANEQQQQPKQEAWQRSVYSIELGDLIFQGAESKVYHCSFYGADAVYKHRFPKRYRNEILDERLRTQRMRHEARALERCAKKGIRAPKLLGADYNETFLVMSHEAGPTLKEALDVEHARVCADPKLAAVADTTPSPVTAALLRSMGVVVAQLHNANMVHGDLTTSNFISAFDPTVAAAQTASAAPVAQTKGKAAATSPSVAAAAAAAALPTAQDIVVLDFGLISDKYSAEERAVDLYVLERAITSTHPYLSNYASEVVLEGYCSAADPKKWAGTLQRLEAVRARGRKRSMVG